MDNPSFIGDNASIPGEYKRNYSQFYPGKHADVESTFSPSNQVHPVKNINSKDPLPDEIPVSYFNIFYCKSTKLVIKL